MSWLLDTDVLSQAGKSQRDETVVSWVRQELPSCFTSSIVIAQLALWVRSREVARRQELEGWLSRLLRELKGKILSFNISVAHVWAEQHRAFEEAGVRMPIEDSYIAATARRYGHTIVTGNDKDFRRPGLKVFNPFKELAKPPGL